MSGVLNRAASFFLAPPAARPEITAAPPPASRVALLGTRADVVPLAAALALSLRAAGRTPTALVAVWPADDTALWFSTPVGRDAVRVGVATRAGDDAARVGVPTRASDDAGRVGSTMRAGDDADRCGPPTRLASRPAARLAARLSAHGLTAAARGRLTWLALPVDPVAAAAAVRRASSVVAGPVVTALTGPRPAGLDDLVAEHDVAVVAADPESALARAALAALAESGVAATALAPLRRGLPRTLALAGFGARRRVAAPLPVREEGA